MSVLCLYLCVRMSVSLQSSKLDLQTSQNCWWWCPWLVPRQVKYGSRSSYLRSFANNSVTETRVLYIRISNNRITRQPLTFFQKKGFLNLEDTGEKAFAQYWDDVERSSLITTKVRVVLASAHFLCTNCNQEALLLQTDCTTRYIKQSLVNCCTIVGTRSTTNPYETEVMHLEHCGRRTCVCV